MQIANKIILGAVQLGLKYGINNTTKKPTTAEAFEILDLAKDHGIHKIDTADAYGNANQIIGDYNKKNKFFRVINKFSKNINSLAKDLEILNVDNFYAYLFHKFNEFENCPYELKKDLIDAKVSQKIENIGVSIYSNQEFKKAINCEWVDIIQLPYNILDNWNIRGELILEAKSKGKLIHNRSIFLQGLLLMNKENIPFYLHPLKSYLKEINFISLKNDISINELCLAYSIKNKNIDGVLFGIDSKNQLIQNLNFINNIQNNKNVNIAIEEVNSNIKIPSNLEQLLNPQNWNI
jgi:aryl-alcohol dehydrogenase-like predicted oxidoreductase